MQRTPDHLGHYEPIDCGFHDELEALATLKRTAHISYRDDAGGKNRVNDIIADVFSRDGAEFVRLDSGLELRLDQLIEVSQHDPDE